jgi:monoamine oxidase
MQVLIVGAGMAGLTAAERLLAGGVDVTLVEAGGRFGGRVRSIGDAFGNSPFVDGVTVESGAEWIDTDQQRMHNLVRRFGLQLATSGHAWTMARRILHLDGRLYTHDQFDALQPGLERQLEAYSALLDALGDGLGDPGHPELHPNAAELDQRSLADVIADAQLSPLAELFGLRNSQGEFAEEPQRVSALFVAQQRALMRVEGARLHGGIEVRSHRLIGGLSQIPQAIAAGLPNTVIRRGRCVRRIEWSDDGATVVLDAGSDGSVESIGADAVIVACSLRAVRQIDFDPPLPDGLSAAISELGCGTVTKTALQYSTRSWPAGYANNTLPSQRMYEPTEDQTGRPVLMAYTGGDGGRRLAADDEPCRMSAVAEDVRAMYGIDQPLGGFSRAWSAEPRYGGSYAVYEPGQVLAHWHTLRSPCGAVHLAGEHVASWTGYMEGAVESGETVAERLLGLS